jgi:hypothetical protein
VCCLLLFACLWLRLPALPFDALHRSRFHSHEATNEGIDFQSDGVKKKRRVRNHFFSSLITATNDLKIEAVADDVQ